MISKGKALLPSKDINTLPDGHCLVFESSANGYWLRIVACFGKYEKFKIQLLIVRHRNLNLSTVEFLNGDSTMTKSVKLGHFSVASIAASLVLISPIKVKAIVYDEAADGDIASFPTVLLSSDVNFVKGMLDQNDDGDSFGLTGLPSGKIDIEVSYITDDPSHSSGSFVFALNTTTPHWSDFIEVSSGTEREIFTTDENFNGQLFFSIHSEFGRPGNYSIGLAGAGEVAAVPLPATVGFLTSGLAALAFARRKKANKRS